MNADALRHFYDYHFAENRKLREQYLPQLTQEQFTQNASYSRGSVASQTVHLMTVDEAWFTGLRGAEFPPDLNPSDAQDRRFINAYWDRVEQEMRAYLANLRDDMLLQKPFPEGEDENLILWQVLLHVVNHGTDHRAQILRQLNEFGVKTESQDYVFYVYEHPQTANANP